MNGNLNLNQNQPQPQPQYQPQIQNINQSFDQPLIVPNQTPTPKINSIPSSPLIPQQNTTSSENPRFLYFVLI